MLEYKEFLLAVILSLCVCGIFFVGLKLKDRLSDWLEKDIKDDEKKKN